MICGEYIMGEWRMGGYGVDMWSEGIAGVSERYRRQSGGC